MSIWWCAKHTCEKDDHQEWDEGPCPLWWVPTTRWEKLACYLGDCPMRGTCLECDGWTEMKQLYGQRWRTSSKFCDWLRSVRKSWTTSGR